MCVFISTCCYSKIYFILRQHQAQVHVQDRVRQGQLNGGGIGINLARYKKTVSSALWVQTIFFLSYMPWGVTTAVFVKTASGLFTPSLYLAVCVTISPTLLNPSHNPFLYCWKMRKVRQAAKDTIRGFWCSS